VSIEASDIITDGIEDLRPGAIVRGRVVASRRYQNRLVEIEIYAIEPSFAELQIKDGTKVYAAQE